MKIKPYELICALPNFPDREEDKVYNDKGVHITRNKCLFDSTMLNLYNSKVVQKVVNELASKAPNKVVGKDVYPSK